MEEKLGKYIFMGMGKCGEHTVCLSVAYKLDYCIKKAEQFVEAAKGAIEFTKINKILVGELKAENVLNTKGELI